MSWCGMLYVVNWSENVIKELLWQGAATYG